MQGQYDFDIPDNPTEQLPFGIEWTPPIDNPSGRQESEEFAPLYYPDRFPQTKEKELTRDSQQCGGEDISIKALKNMEFHINGLILADEVPVLKQLQDYEGVCDIYSPLSPTGGVECYITHIEINATPSGYDAVHKMWMFEYSIDAVSTGTDEYAGGNNAIVSAIGPPAQAGGQRVQ